MHCGVYSIVQKYKEIACFCSLLYYIYCNSQSNSLLENLSIFPLICCKMELWFKSIFLSVCVQNFSYSIIHVHCTCKILHAWCLCSSHPFNAKNTPSAYHCKKMLALLVTLLWPHGCWSGLPNVLIWWT